MKIQRVLLVSLLSISVSAWADDWSKRGKDDFTIDPPKVVEEVDEPAPPPVVEEKKPQEPAKKPEEKKPEAKKSDPKKEKVEAAAKSKVPKNLKTVKARRLNGSKIAFDKIVIFACMNISNNRYLFNKKQTDHCLIKNQKEVELIAKKIGGDHFGQNTVFFESCPDEMATEKNCNPKSLRNF